MFAQLAVTVALALAAAGSPLVVRNTPVSLPLVRNFNMTGTKTLLQRDQARIKAFRSATKPTPNAAQASASAAAAPVPVVNQAVTYTAEVCILA